MKKCLLALLFGVCFTSLFAQNSSYTGSLQNTDPTFNRPDEGMPPVTLSAFTNVYYNVITLNVSATGPVTFGSSSLWDNFMVLYNSTGFFPATPLTNAILANDDFSGPNAGFTYNFTATGTYTLVICSYKNNVTGSYSITTSAGIILPLRLLSFTAAKGSGNSNIIKWSSADEGAFGSYQVQRSIDGNNFNDLINGSVEVKNNTANSYYSFTDNNPPSRYNYYRLKMIEKDGSISFSPVVLVKTKSGIINLNVFPNPSSEYLTIEVKAIQNSKVFISIINAVGQLMQNGQYNFNNQGILPVSIRRLPVGKYFLKTTIDGEATTIAFIKN